MATDQQMLHLTSDEATLADFPLIHGTVGFDGIDVRTLLARTNMVTYDPSFGSTASCRSAITYVDGENGVLLHRGYPIDELAERATYLEVAHLLLFGELPTEAEFNGFNHDITYHTMVHEQLLRFFSGFPRDAHPMAVLLGVVGALSAFYPDSTDVFDAKHRLISIHRLLAKMPTLAAMAYKHSVGQPMVYPQNRFNYTENFLYMMFSVPAEEYTINPVYARALNALMIVQADHEQNASTSTVRTVGSTLANPFACVAGGIASLWGPIHGGANEAVVSMLGQIGRKENIAAFVARAKDPSDEFRLMGFGHRVYKSYDPRAKVMQKICEDVLGETSGNDPQLELARELERIVLADDYFIKRKLYPNVDFYSGIVMRAIGIPLKMFTPIFAVARTAGWLAQWKEMIEDPDQRIARPRQVYIGKPQRAFVARPERQAGASRTLSTERPMPGEAVIVGS